MTTTCLLLCGGSNTRWGGYRGARRKHLIEIEGEILLERTLRQVAAHAPGRTIVVIHEEDRDLYRARVTLPTEIVSVPRFDGPEFEARKFLSSRPFWNDRGRTIVLLGDVWFSDAAIETIFADAAEGWTAFGRPGASRWTGCPYGELFAQRFTAIDAHEDALLRLDAMYRDRSCRRAAAGWAHYQLMIGRHPHDHVVGPRFVEIDDFTEDFDLPHDYDAWVLGRRSAAATTSRRDEETGRARSSRPPPESSDVLNPDGSYG